MRLVFLQDLCTCFLPTSSIMFRDSALQPLCAVQLHSLKDGTFRLMDTELEFQKWLSELYLVKCNTDFTQYRCYKCKSWKQETILGWVTTYYMAEQHILQSGARKTGPPSRRPTWAQVLDSVQEIKQMQMQSTYCLEKVLKMISLYVNALLCQQ